MGLAEDHNRIIEVLVKKLQPQADPHMQVSYLEAVVQCHVNRPTAI
jgi:hypothetical protein